MNTPFKTDLLVELHVPDFAAVSAYYGALGFAPVWQEPNYLVLKKGDSVLNFYGGGPDIDKHSYFSKFPDGNKSGFRVEIVIFESELFEFYESIKSTHNVVAAPQLRPWGKWDFRLEDPNGFYLRISEPYNTVERPAPHRHEELENIHSCELCHPRKSS